MRLRISHKLTLALAALLLDRRGRPRAKLLDELADDHAPEVERALVELRAAHPADEPEEMAKVERLEAAWGDFRRLRSSRPRRPTRPRRPPKGYSRFAARVADGHLGERLAPGGADEVAELGRALDLLVGRHEWRRDYEASQAELADTMAVAANASSAPGQPAS